MPYRKNMIAVTSHAKKYIQSISDRFGDDETAVDRMVYTCRAFAALDRQVKEKKGKGLEEYVLECLGDQMQYEI